MESCHGSKRLTGIIGWVLLLAPACEEHSDKRSEEIATKPGHDAGASAVLDASDGEELPERTNEAGARMTEGPEADDAGPDEVRVVFETDPCSPEVSDDDGNCIECRDEQNCAVERCMQTTCEKRTCGVAIPVDAGTLCSTGICDSAGLCVGTQIINNFEHACALRSDGLVWCWGESADGVLGDGKASQDETCVRVVGAESTTEEYKEVKEEYDCAKTPVQPKGLEDVAELQGERDGYCALKRDGTLWCWGDLGMKLSDPACEEAVGSRRALCPTPVKIADDVSSFAYHRMIALRDGGLLRWGVNFNNTGEDTLEPAWAPICFGAPAASEPTCADQIDFAEIGALSAIRELGVARLNAGSSHACAVLKDGRVACWGSNNRNQLGCGGQEVEGCGETSTPVFVSGIDEAVDLASGREHTCALMRDGHVRCWGFGANGELGDGVNRRTDVPVQVADVDDAVALTSDKWSTSCVLKQNGNAACWGGGDFRPVDRGVTDALSVLRRCVMDAEQRVYCDDDGQTREIPIPALTAD